MRLLDKYRTLEEAAVAKRRQYSRALETYCFNRYRLSGTTEHGLFWINLHYLCGLTSTNKESNNSVFS